MAALTGLPSARPIDRVRSWILVAEGYADRGDTEKTSAALKTAVELTKDLQLLDGALVFTEMATFYLPTGARDVGQQMLTASLQMLGDYPMKSSPEYFDAVKKLAAVLDDDPDRREDIVTLLTPIVDEAQASSGGDAGLDELWGSYAAFSVMLEDALRELGSVEAAVQREKLRGEWPKPPKGDKAEMVLAGRTRRVDPFYPQVAKALRIQGTVTLSVEIGIDGLVRRLRVKRPVPFGLTSEAIRAVRQWRYRPLLINGAPAPVATDINVVFQLR